MPDLSTFSSLESKAAADAYIEEIKNDPSCNDWLLSALDQALKRDPVDAANDAEALSMILQMRASAILAEAVKKF